MTKWYLGVTMTGEDLQAAVDSESITGYTLHDNGVELRYGMAFPAGVSVEHDDEHRPPDWMEKLAKSLRHVPAGTAIAKVLTGGPGDGCFQVWRINGEFPHPYADEELDRHVNGVNARLTIRAQEEAIDELAADIAGHLKAKWQYFTTADADQYDVLRAIRKAGRRAGKLIGHKVSTTEVEVGNGKVRVAVYVEDIPADVMAEQQARAVEASG